MSRRVPLSACPEADELVRFAEGKLTGAEREAIFHHIDACPDCHDVVAELARTSTRPPPVSFEGEALERESLLAGRFRLVAPLGAGAMGTVYRAHDETLGTDVALKRVRAHGAAAKAVAREVSVGRRVTHPNVCRIHDVGEDEDGDAFITMELVEGETLAERLARTSPAELSADEALAILDGIARGLAAVHAEGIVHRDLKPANVMLERATGRPMLTDFGFAADIEVKQSRRLVGTPAYWSPEQARGEPATPASDVYSFGLVAYRLLARREFAISDAKALEAIPLRYRAFVARCLEPKPSRRFEDAAVLVARLAPLRARGVRPAVFVVASVAAIVAVVVVTLGRSSGPAPDPSGASTTNAASAIGAAVSSRASAGSVTSAVPAVSATAASAASLASSSRPVSVISQSSAILPLSSVPNATSTGRVHPPGGRALPPVPSTRPSGSSDGDILYRH